MSRSSMYYTRRSMLLWQGTWQTDGCNEVFNYIDCVYFIFQGGSKCYMSSNGCNSGLMPLTRTPWICTDRTRESFHVYSDSSILKKHTVSYCI
jgi:hypothetical protein